MPAFDIELSGFERLKRNTEDLIPGPLKNLLVTASLRARNVARQGVSSNSPVARTILNEVQPMSAKVFSVMSENRTRSIEVGRQAGGPLLHTDALKRWIKRVGFSGSPFALARAIQRRGVKGRFFMQAAFKSARENLPRDLTAMGQEIGKLFGRR